MTYVLSFLCMHAWTILYGHVWIFLKCIDWFNHHFVLPTDLLSSLWCIFAHVFPSHLSTITSCQGTHSSQPTCVKTSHSPSLTHYSGHILATDRFILLASVWNLSQGIAIQPTAGTPTLNGLRSNWDFLLGKSLDMLAHLAPSTFWH